MLWILGWILLWLCELADSYSGSIHFFNFFPRLKASEVEASMHQRHLKEAQVQKWKSSFGSGISLELEHVGVSLNGGTPQTPQNDQF